jgi:anti-sigma regulatory factor (Ser/Thr protein kinase)
MSGPAIQDRRRAPTRARTAAPRPGARAVVRRLGFSFSGEPAQVVRARHRVEALLESQWGKSPEADDAALVACEIFTNGARYGGGRVRVRARVSSRSITLKVSTPAPWRDPEAQRCALDEERGRGLEIVEALAASVCIWPDIDGCGVTVTVVCLAAPARAAAADPAGV